MGYNELSAEDKMAKAFNNLMIIRPFYSSIYSCMERVYTDSVPTMGVSKDKLVINRDFVNELEFGELMFVNLHEITHVALMHVARRKNRDSELWNIACDLYVNKFLAVEFGIKPGMESSNGLVKMTTDCCYTDTLDLDNDYVEAIYDNLYAQAENNGYNEAKMLNDSSKGFEFTWEGKSKGRFGDGSPFSTTLVPNSYDNDLSDCSGEDQNELEQDCKKVIQEAITRHEMVNKSAGNSTDSLERMVRSILKSRVNWKKLLIKYCIAITRTDTSFNKPDRRMYYQSAIYPGQSADELSFLQDIKVCLDTSGSVTNEELAYFYGQVLDILKHFKVEAELIFWDTKIQGVSKFTDKAELLSAEVSGYGGTNPECLFEYFDSKKCKRKPAAVLVFTDGYFSTFELESRWPRKYKNTIWVLSKNHNDRFEPPFGVRAEVIYGN